MKKDLNIFRFIRLMMVMIIAFVGMNSCTTDDVAAMEEQEDNLVVFDFTSASELTAWGVDIPASGSGPISVHCLNYPQPSLQRMLKVRIRFEYGQPIAVSSTYVYIMVMR